MSSPQLKSRRSPDDAWRPAQLLTDRATDRTSRTLVMATVGAVLGTVAVIGVLMVLWAPPDCEPFAATPGPPMECRASWAVGTGTAIALLALAAGAMLLYDAVRRQRR